MAEEKKAARRARNKRKKYFLNLASRHPARFEDEWEKRIDSWLDRIRLDAGRIDPVNCELNSVFGLIDEALAILAYCGNDIFERYAPATADLMLGQCITSFNREALPKILRYKNKRFPSWEDK
ncbi:MAG: hypothetical protein U9Q39_04190 [Pseudomonadota bacterium]|nr:hypothetical protein [Pseudomonadota bacterium]